MATARPAASPSIGGRVTHPEFQPQMVEPLRVHYPPILQQLPQAFEPGFGEEGCRPRPIAFVPSLTSPRASMLRIALGSLAGLRIWRQTIRMALRARCLLIAMET